MAFIVGLIGVVDLGNEIQQQFETTLDRAELLRGVATRLVVQTLDRQRTVPLREALRDPALSDNLTGFMTNIRPVLEIAVCDPGNEILADTEPDRLGKTFPGYADFGPVVSHTSVWSKMRLLMSDKRYYQLEQPLGTGGKPLLFVRVVVYPALIRSSIMPRLKKNAAVAGGSILGSVCITLLFSTIAFRPLGQLGRMLDMLARGEY